ncbi:Large exoprotein involved in heme utilizationor adhesion [Bibersteinia trehalosi USDA-ARS-USMARC-190]|uniref:Large exoprotein involved in heme utilizationor adhesion n=2 Tax=Bibersteinia trehalosi TaxID=47735 RepID=W0R638_BIBTR|nr:hemagglutinin repeat-containing protein [Bibersteinia trehalosi]AHG86216.1 Large exoprotein involved in heme utilizationor adhesion [Bibersteinia trehalosi USDA-ARS-USMARC-190]
MNKQCFRVIFSKTLQRLVVVSELAKSEGKSSEPSSFPVLPLFAKIRPLTFSLFCALGFVTFSDAALGETLIIRADKSAPKNQQPIILSTANGIPQVNIQTPNDKGLSHNKYSQFDVAEKGAILNNSRTNTQTQLAGQVAGNPYLARGEAKVILNEVNSSKPSVMKGYVEVAGKKAEVIIANPSGLHCEGCGIINSDRTTLTTGKPQIKHGHLDSFVVEKGKVKVSGKGLDNSRVDYTEIISRHVEANAGIWSKKETSVITGKNTVKRSDSDKNLQIIHTKQALAGEPKPQVAIDVGELGGMYSGKIHLIGTEQGVGVRNAGHIGASAETLTIDNQGRIVNRGTFNAQKQVQLTAQNGIDNQGKIENKQGDIQLNSKADIQNSGSIVARSGNIQKKAETKIQQSGETVAKGNIAYTARQIHADKNSLIAAGVEVTDSAQGEVRKLETQSAAGKTIQLTATEKATVQGKNLASGKLNVSAADIDANQSQNNAHTVEYSAKSGDIQANNAYFTAEQLTLSTPNELSTQGSFLTAKAINTSQQFLNAQNAVWKQTGEQDFHLTGESVNTQGSEFSTQGKFFINARQLDNKQGTLSSGKSLYLNVNGNLNSADGTLFAGENLTLNSQHLNNDNGLIYAKQKAGITVKNGLVSNKNTNAEDKGIIAGEEVLLESQTLDNTNGKIISKNSRFTTSQINNQEGVIRSEHNAEINADTLLNNKGIISSAQKANLTVSDISQQNGTIEAQVLQLNSNVLASTENSLIFAEQLNITTKGELNNQDSRIVAKKAAYLTTNGNVTNTNGTIGSQTADLYFNTNQQQLNNTEGKIVAAQQLNVKSGSLSNEQGLITANNISLDTGNGTLNNQNTLTSKKDKGIIAQQNLALNTKVLDNQRGNINSFNNTQLNTAEITNDSGQIRISGDLDIQAKNLSQQNGLITAGKATLALSELNSSQNSEISANEITLNADKVINQHSRLQAEKSFTLEAKQGITNHNGIIASKTASLAINTHQSTLDNANGTLFAQHALTIQSGELDNRAGLISAKQTEINTQQHQIDNRNTQAENKGIIGLEKLSLDNLSSLNNEKGFIHSNQQLTASVTSNINNQQGILNSNEDLTLNAAQIDNQAGTISAKTAEVNAKSIDNNAVSEVGSLILGTTQLVLNAEQLNNQNTKRKTADNAPTQGIQAGELVLNANTLSNQQGGIYIADLATMTVNQTLNNQNGEVLSDNGLTIKDNGNLSLNNQEGLIQAKNRINLTAKTLEQEGTIKTQGDLTVRLKDSFTLNNAFEVGNNLDFSTQGDFTNNVALLIGNSATLSADQIINTASGEISSKNSKLTANEITNRGLIDGEQTLLNATQINNIGTGRIYGDHLALGSNQLINREENGSSATIAARKRLDFGVNKIINSNGSTMMSLGTMHFGKTLDENHQAVGLADSVQNHNAVIEALGRISFNVKGVENQHKLLKLEMQETSRIPIFEYSFGNEPQRYAKDTEGLTKIKRDNDSSHWGTNRNVKNLYALRLPDGRESEEWREYDYIRTINESMIIPAVYDEAKIISGDKIDFYSSDVKNADSKIIANTGIEYHQGAKIDNNSTLGVLITTEKGKMTQFYNGKACAKKIFGKCVDHYRTTKSDTFIYNHETNSTKTFDLWEYSPNKNEKIVLGKDLEPQTKAKNVSLEIVSITGSDTNPNSGTVNIKLTPTISEQDKNKIIDSGQVVGKLDTTVENFDANKLGELEMPTIKTHLADINLPQTSLYKINPEATNGYIVETDPKFTDRKQWLSSDYMFEQLRHNHDNVHKRLGDGFYEQRLINEQINQLTGRRFIEGYTSDLAQYQALMNSGIKYAKQFNLAVGVGLTAKQMSELTTDMVWLVNKEITLADGRKVTALVPQVYLVARNSDITSRGAVISANQIIGSADKIENSGVIAGLDLTRLHSNQLENRGAVLGKNVDLSAQQTLINLGGTIGAVDFLSLYGGKGVEIASTLSHSENTENTFIRTQLDRLASVKVTGDNGKLNIQSGGDITLKATSLNSTGSINIGAEKSLNITTLKTQNREHYNGNADNYYRLDQSAEVGNVISAKGDIRAVSGGDMTVRQSDISSESGEVLLGSRQGDVRIEAGRAEERLETARKSTSRGIFNKTTSTYRYTHDISEAIGSNIDGRKVNVIAQSGDVLVKGSSVVGDEALAIYGKNNVSIVSDINTLYQDELSMSKKSGLMGSGFGFTIGSKKEQIEQDRTQQSAARSQVGSLSGDTAIYAGNHYQQTGSIVTSRDGDVDITAKSANITAARSDYESNYKRTTEQKGVTVAISTPITNAIQAVENTINSAKAVGSSKNDRINALGAVNAGFEAMRTAEQVGKLAEALSQNPTQALGQDVSVSITYGEQKSVETQHSEGNKVEKSQVNAGGKVNIRTEGDSKNSTLTIAGSDVSGKGGTHLKAEGGVNILAVDENHLERSKNKSSGFNAGVAISYGSSGFAFGVTAGGNVAKGYGNGESQAWVGSQVGSLSSQTTIENGGDVNIISSQVKGKSVKVNAENLNIQSLQDTMKYEGKQESVSGQVTVGYGVSGSASYSKSKMNADYASVNQQAGIFAGDEGYDMDIKNRVQLAGGAVLSTAEKDKNQLSARTFSFTDIENHSNAKASSTGFGMGFSVGRDQTSQEDKEKNEVYRVERERNGETFEQANPNQANSSPIKFGLGENDVHSADFYALAKIGAVNLLSNTKKSENASSITSSVISDGIFNIQDVEGQENLDRITKSKVEQTNHLDKPDYQSLRKEVETDSSIKRQFFSNIAGFTDEAYRTMFIAEHRMMTAEVDENGNPIEDSKLLAEINKEADKKGVDREEYLNDQESKGRNIYRLREISDQERNNLEKVTYTDPLTGKSETRYVVAFNGIFNDENAAAKFAWQNYMAKESESGKIDSRIYKDVYFVHHPEAKNPISELLVAGYEKMFEGSFGNLLGMDNSSLQAKDIMTKYGKDNLFIGSHSRGTLTVANALSALNTKENREAKLLSDTKVKMVGPAANVTNSDNTLSQLQTGSSRNEENKNGSIRIENHKLDPVGSLPIVLGGNLATMNDNVHDRGVVRRILDMFGPDSSMHNCYGLGQEQCVMDGYRKENDLIMNKEQTIYDLNRNSNNK